MKKVIKTLLSVFLTIGLMGGSTPSHTFFIKGSVIDRAGRGIAGVVVNDGIHFTLTDSNGRWELSTDTTRSKFVSISTPADYHLPSADGLAAGFYVPVHMATDGKNVVFRLSKRTEQTGLFHYIAISDPQIADSAQMRRWKNEAATDIMRSADSLSRTGEVVLMTLGDLVFDNMTLLDEYRQTLNHRGITAFQCIGNHDFDMRYPDLDNSPEGAPHYAEMQYGRRFGPVNYSFNIGRAHVITMKNISYRGNKRYTERMSEADIEWLRRDLSYVKRGTLVILNMHAPAWNRSETDANMRNADRLARVLSGYNVHVFCGHTHFFENVEVSPTLYQHNIGAACGTWWKGEVNRCGAPNGFMLVDVQGDSLMWHYKGNGMPLAEQMRVYPEGTFSHRPHSIVANIWDWDSRCKAYWYQDGKPMGAMTRYKDFDPEGRALIANSYDLKRTNHLFCATPQGRWSRIRIVYRNRFGETSTKEVTR